MSRKHIRNLINKANAQKSTGPRSEAGKQRAKLNAFRHGLSGQHLVLVEHEHGAYYALCDMMLLDLEPKTEMERQIAQKIIDINFRLNRITAIESNMYNLDTMKHTSDAVQDDRVEIMCAQTRAWKADAQSFEILGRYEMRLSRQLLNYQKEFERLQTVRKAEEKVRQTEEPKADNPEMGSFGNPVPKYVMQDDIARMNAAASMEPRIASAVLESTENVSQPAETTPLDPNLASFGQPVPPPVHAAPAASLMDARITSAPLHSGPAAKPPLPSPARLRVPGPPLEKAA